MKLFITDYDDTLYTSDKSIKENIKYLRKLQENDFKIIISTGRSFPSIKKQTKEYGIPYDYLSCADGSVIYDKDNNIIKSFTMDEKIVKPLENFYHNLNFEEIQFSYPEYYSNQYLGKDKLLGINICFANQNYHKKIIKDFFKLKNDFPNYNYLNYAHSNYSYLCVKPINVSKSFSIKYLQELLNVDTNDIYVIGDSSNDFEMIRDYHGVGMKNSCPDILNIARKRYDEVSDYINEILAHIP